MPVPSLQVAHYGEPLTCSPWCDPGDVDVSVREQVTDPGLLSSAVGVASDVLYALSGRRWRGHCTRTVELQIGTCGCYAPAGRVERWGWLYLPDWPVTSVDAATSGGVALDVTEMRPRSGRWVQRVDAVDGRTLGGPRGELSISYSYGQYPPASARLPTARLAGEIALAFSPSASGACSLPSRVQSYNRQGVDVVVLDPMDFLDKGRTGIVEIDMWLAAVNPHGLTQPARVWSPDLDPTTGSYR